MAGPKKKEQITTKKGKVCDEVGPRPVSNWVLKDTPNNPNQNYLETQKLV